MTSTPVTPQQLTTSQQHPFLKLINRQDYQKWQSSRNKIVIAPLIFFTSASIAAIFGKRLQLGRFLSNPLKKAESLQTSKNRWDFLIKHSIIFGTLGFAVGAYFKKQFNKYLIFKEYQKQVNFYMRWKIQTQIKAMISEQRSLTQQEKMRQVSKLY